jgi:PAS domain S-box-containing protein
MSELISQIFDSIPDEIVVMNKDKVVQEANASFLRNNGLTMDEVKGRHCYQLKRHISGQCRFSETRECSFDTVMEEKKSKFEVYDCPDENGETSYFVVVGAPVLDENGNAIGMMEMTRNITRRIRFEKELQAKEEMVEAELTQTREYLESILENTGVMIITSDLDGNMVSFNRGAEEGLGYKAEEMIGKPTNTLYSNKDQREEIVRLIEGRDSVTNFETTVICKDGSTLQVLITLSMLKDSSGKKIGTVGMARDISHRRALMEQVIQSERQAAVGRLGAGVAHEINNPLAMIGEIAGYLHDLATLDNENGNTEELMAEIKDGIPKLLHHVRRGRSITQRLLNFARKTTLEVHEVNVNEALEEVVPFLAKEAKTANVEIFLETRSKMGLVAVEEMQLQEIFINLIKNAIQAMRPSGKGNLWISTNEEKSKVIISIKDDGPGIADEVRERIFDPFVTTKDPGQGTGLGLSICYGIVKRYDGEIRVHSESGQGTTFNVIFPAIVENNS